MKKIVCELCEGTVFDKVDGRFVCKGCGTSYSAEEARGMMREVEGDEPVATGAPVMPQMNPNQQQIDNMLILATTAFDADNNAEAENYCNQVIALDAMNYKAWLLKGRAAGWQSTLQNPRITEAAHFFAQAIDFAPEEEKEAVKEEAVDQLKRLGLACISLRKNRFSQYPDAEELAGFDSDRRTLLDALMVLLSKGIAAGIPEGYEEEIAVMMNQAAVAGYKTATNNYNNDNHPVESDWNRCRDAILNCAELTKKAIDASDADDEADITRYENLVIYYESVCELKCYTGYGEYTRVGMQDSGIRKYRGLAQDAKNMIAKIKKSVEDAKVAAAKKEEEEKQARIEAYWSAHAEEKAALDAEKKELTEKSTALGKEIAEIDSQINALDPKGKVPSEEEKSKLEDEIRELSNRRAKLGLFAGKEKKQINEDIAALEGRKDALNAKIEEEKKAKKAEAEQKMAPLKTKRSELSDQKETADKRIAAINKELTKDPEE